MVSARAAMPAVKLLRPGPPGSPNPPSLVAPMTLIAEIPRILRRAMCLGTRHEYPQFSQVRSYSLANKPIRIIQTIGQASTTRPIPAAARAWLVSDRRAGLRCVASP
jgi:hypothetical protein